MIEPIPNTLRARNAAATRQAILKAARRHFARENYDRVGVRKIARDASVDPALISRYFGSKKELFREALQREGSGTIFDGVATSDLASHLVSVILDADWDTEHADEQLDRLLIILHSATSPEASAIVCEAISKLILIPIASRLNAPDAPLRAALALVVLLGSEIVCNVLSPISMSKVENTAWRRHLTALFNTALSAAKI